MKNLITEILCYLNRILSDASFCVEDHTTYTCVFGDQNIFKEMLTCLIQKIKEYALKRLEQCGKCTSVSFRVIITLRKNQFNFSPYFLVERAGIENLNSTRLCIKCLDYFRIYQCQKDFYDYILCIRNGSLNEYLFK